MAKEHFDGHYIVSIDIGSSKIVILLADKEGGVLKISGYAQGDSIGVKKGDIIDVEEVANAIKKVKEKFRLSCKDKFDSVVVNISDPSLKVFNFNPHRHVNSKVKKEDVEELIKTAEAVKIKENERHISSIAHHYILDKDPYTQQGVVVKRPIGEEAETLEANVHTVIASKQLAKNIENSTELNGIKVLNFVPSSEASSEPYLTQDEKDSGICLVDIGSGVMDLSVFKDGSIFYSTTIQMGTDQVTDDIANAFNTSFQEAERLKLRYGQAQVKAIVEDKLIQFQQIDNSEYYYLSHESLTEVIEASYLKLFALIRKQLNDEKLYRSLKAGFVLVGGGVKIKRCKDLMFSCYKKRVKIGHVNTDLICIHPNFVSSKYNLLEPEYACALGLLLSKGNESGLKKQQSSNREGFLSKIKGIKESF